MIAIKLMLFFLLVNVTPGAALAFYFTRNKEGAGLLDKLVIAAILSPLVLVLISFLEESSGVPQNVTVLLANIVLLVAVNVTLVAKFFRRKADLALNLSWVKLLVYGLFGSLIVFRVLPTLDLMAPILHDPIAHSEWLKILNTTHFTTTAQWYPQGLEYFLNYYATFFDFTYPQIILVSQGALLAVFPIGMFFVGWFSFRGKDKWMLFALIALVVSARMARPTEYYFVGGKNAMVFAFTAAPLILYLAAVVRSRWDYVIVALMTFAVIAIHYPTGFFLLFALFFMNLGELVDFRSLLRRKLSIDRKTLWNYLIAAAVLVVPAVLLLRKIAPIYTGYPIDHDRSFDPFVVLLQDAGIVYYIYNNFLDDYIRELKLPWVLAFVAALSAFVFVADKQKWFAKRILATFVALYLIGIPLLKLVPRLGLNFNIEVRFFLIMVMAVIMSWFVYYVLERTVLRLGYTAAVSAALALLLGLVFLQGGLAQYRQYKARQADIDTVKTQDREAFDFINSEIGDDRSFLIQIGTPSAGTNIIAGSDSGVWIPSYTDKKVEVSFLDFASGRSQDIFDAYLEVAKHSSDPKAVSKLYCDYNIGYVFFGSREIYFHNMKPEDLASSGYFRKIFDNGAVIFRIQPVDCTQKQPAS